VVGWLTTGNPTPSVTSVVDWQSGGDPSAVYCAEVGGGLYEIRSNEDGAEYGMCTFGISTACVSWAYFRGECDADNPIFSAFCDERGGRVSTFSLGTGGANAAATSSYDACIREDGEVCSEYSYYSGDCNTATWVQSSFRPISDVVIPPTPGGHGNAGSWSYLSVTLPTPLSDMSITLLAVEGGVGNGESGGEEVTTGFIITGGCDSPNGNQLHADMGEDVFVCYSLSTKAYGFVPTRPTQFQAWGGQFTTLADMPRARYRHASAVVDGRVCVFGGRDIYDALIAEVDCYNPLSNEWSTPTTLPTEYTSSDLAAFATEDDIVHLIGGYDAAYTALDQVTVLDMSNFDAISYSDGPKLSTKRGDIHVAVANNGDAYVAGGYTHENNFETPIKSVEKYDVATRTWSMIAPLNEERGDAQLVASDSNIYAIGGETNVGSFNSTSANTQFTPRINVLDSVEVLDHGEEVWRYSESMPEQMSRFGAIGWVAEEESFIFAFGGQTTFNPSCRCFPSTEKVMVFSQIDVNEETVSSSPGDGADSIASPIFMPSNPPTRAMVGTADSSGAVLVENYEDEEVASESSGNGAGNIESPSLKPSANSTIQALGDTSNQSDSASSAYPTAAENSTPPLPVSSPMPSPHPSTAPSDERSDMPSATLTEDTVFDYEPSGGGRLNYFSCKGLFVPLLGFILILLMTI